MTTESDRELLEAAARAAGVDASWINDPDYEARNEGMWMNGARSPDNSKYWNPLRDDGDALRLAVKLGIDVSHYPAFDGCYEAFSRAVWHFDDESYGECDEKHGDDPNAATRRAIVRAAAAIGAHKEGA